MRAPSTVRTSNEKASKMATLNFPTIESLKTQAKNLRKTLSNDGESITHSEALELIAKQHGFRDWNTLHAAQESQPNEAALEE